MKVLHYPTHQKVEATLTLPGSKYLANRLVILAALCESETQLSNMPHNEDIDAAIAGLTKLGAQFNWQDNTLSCRGFKDVSELPETDVYSHHSGSFSRFVTPLLALSKNSVHLSGSDKMNTRPMEELFAALKELGADIRSEEQKEQQPHFIKERLPETLPVYIKGPIGGGSVDMKGTTSSQYISALLMVAGKMKNSLTINLPATPVSKPYLLMTIDLLNQFGVEVKHDKDLKTFVIQSEQRYQAKDFELESDPSSASYFLAAAAITGGHICITNFKPERSLQGEAQFAEVLESMGCEIWQDEAGYHCQGPETLKAIEIDMCDMPDVVQTLAVVASFAKGTTHITHIETLAFKESNRIEDTATELRKTGIEVTTTESSMSIIGGNPKSATFDTYDDHRMAMSLALMALKVDGIKMNDPEVVGKSFPKYWQYLQQVGYDFNE